MKKPNDYERAAGEVTVETIHAGMTKNKTFYSAQNLEASSLAWDAKWPEEPKVSVLTRPTLSNLHLILNMRIGSGTYLKWKGEDAHYHHAYPGYIMGHFHKGHLSIDEVINLLMEMRKAGADNVALTRASEDALTHYKALREASTGE